MRQEVSIQNRVHSSGVPACWMSKVPIAWNTTRRLSAYLYVCPCMRYLCMHYIYQICRRDEELVWFNPYECMVQQINMMLHEYNA
jgi:hypothetical protein